jgi:hypothetical protein
MDAFQARTIDIHHQEEQPWVAIDHIKLHHQFHTSEI